LFDDTEKSSKLFKVGFGFVLLTVFVFFMGIELSTFGLGDQFLNRDTQLRIMVATQTNVALQSGALVPLHVDKVIVRRDSKLGVHFIFSVTSEKSKTAKFAASSLQTVTLSDPLSIESREPELEVVGPSKLWPSSSLKNSLSGYSLVLNKFPGIRDHVLIVTDEFRDQSEDLDASDLGALYAVVSEVKDMLYSAFHYIPMTTYIHDESFSL
jgi:ATP adenylyltransferase/5',5'''-P-1,P-4-tetraphosphate phosphorylase II